MLHCHQYLSRRFALISVVMLLPLLIVRPNAQNPQPSALQVPGGSSHSRDQAEKKDGLTREQLEREVWAWHRANLKRLEDRYPSGAVALTTDVINHDINDISVIESDGRIAMPVTPFDLNGFAVQFTPAGANYTVTSFPAAFDTNFGTKLDFTMPPAINPYDGSELGDDACIVQSLGFNFSFYGSIFSNVNITTNGTLTFQPGDIFPSDYPFRSVNSLESLTDFREGLPRIAPYWHDLVATASQTMGDNGVFIRKDNNRVLITWNNLRDFSEGTSGNRGTHRFQVSLFNDGRIIFTYDFAQLTRSALIGITPGKSQSDPNLVDFSKPPLDAIGGPIGQFFLTQARVDYVGAIQAFYATHPGMTFMILST